MTKFKYILNKIRKSKINKIGILKGIWKDIQMAKSIEMNIKEDSGYEVLYPTTTIDSVINLQNQLNQYLPLAGGTMNGNLILNTSSPMDDLQAVSKGYVDNTVGNAVGKLLYSGKLTTTCGKTTTHTISGMSKCKVLLFHFYLLASDSVFKLSFYYPSVGTIWSTDSFASEGVYNASIMLMGPKKYDVVIFSGDNDNVIGDEEYNERGIDYSDTLQITSQGNHVALPEGTRFQLYVEFFKIA